MADNFDPYYKWLAIPPDEQPPHSYRLLGLRLFEGNVDAIGNAADQRMAHVRTFQTGPNGPATQRLLNEIAAARVCLLNPNKKAAYDQQLRAALQPAPVIPPPVPPATSPSAAFLPLATGPPAIALPGMAPLPLPAAAAHAAWPGALAASEREPALDSADPAADGSDDLDADPAELTHVAGRRGAKRQQNSLVLLVPIGIAGLLAIVALLALSGSSQSPMAGPSAAPQEPAAQP
ncbi:MAG TPA: hypothetical protein VG433_09040, partial [Pirellulales bacterium]|nr:hypothetical protein [Pirellulales bacterium]